MKIYPLNKWEDKSLYRDSLSKSVYQFLVKYLNLELDCVKVIKTTSDFNIKRYEDNSCSAIVNIKRINDVKCIRQFFKTVNDKLEINGYYIFTAETHSQRRKRLKKKISKFFFPIYYTFDFIFKRIFPKWSPTRAFYFALTNGRNRALSETEILGRIVSCGFDILDIKEIEGQAYYVTKKINNVDTIPYSSSGFIFKMKRTGKNGKPIWVYKFRTMHPYAEYLQEYIHKKNNLKDGGKFKNDFRITSWGRFMRKFWIDELPMIYNLLKGDLKLIGVRPLSKQYLSLYSKELISMRRNTKPGLAPPFYADNPTTLVEIMNSEKKYIMDYEKNPITTDVKYFFKICNNIFFKSATSC